MIELKELTLLIDPLVRAKHGIRVWANDDVSPVLDFLFDDRQITEDQREGVIEFLRRVAITGLPRDDTKCKKLKKYESLWELKKKPFRILFFLNGSDLILCEMHSKGPDNWENRCLDRAESRRIAYLKQLTPGR